MPRYAKSTAVRGEESSKAKDKQMQGALCALANQAPSRGEKSKSIHKIANEYGVSRFTLKCLADGGQSMRQFNASKRHFTENARLREALENERTRNSAQSWVLLCPNTMIFVQHMTLEQQNTHLYAKEQSRQSRKTKLLQTKHGRHLTGEKFREVGGLDEKEVRMKKQAAEMRKAKREQKKEVKKWREAARIRRKAQQDADIEEWKAENVARVARGEKAVNKRPRMPPKERTPDIFKSEESDCEGEAGVEAEDEEV
jgi:hypothetical protein